MSKQITDDASGLDMTDLLKDITVERNRNHFRYRFPDGAMLDMTMREVLLWEILKELRRIGREVDANSF